jgi:small-conductance mechanosensitive channel
LSFLFEIMFSIILPYTDGLRALPGGDFSAFLIILVVLSLLFQLVLAVALKILGFMASRTKTDLDDRLVRAAAGFLPAIAVFTSLAISLAEVYPDEVVFGRYSWSDLYVLVIMTVAGLLLSAIADAFLLWYGLEIRSKGGKKIKEAEVFPFVRNVVKIAIVAVFAVFVLQKLGFETGAIITGLGVGGIAVALALQDTLGNFFAGVHILVDKPFREEDYVKLESGQEGTVKQIGWRTTRIVTLAQNEIIIPNSKMAGAIMENYCTPNDLSGVLYTIGVDYSEDIDRVEKIITDTLHAVAAGEPLMDEGTIWVRFDAFSAYSLDFKFGYLVRGYLNRFAVVKKVNRELFYAFRKKGITIPFPVRTVYNVPLPQQKK